MRLSGIVEESYVDGPGIRMVLFTQGCPHGCPHCHNPGSWPMDGGELFTIREIARIFRRAKKTRRNLQGVTFSGGEPFLQAAELALTALEAHKLGWDVVVYSGFTYEELLCQKDGAGDLLAASHILIDGRYIHEQRVLNLPFRGSDNQRVIDLVKTREAEQVVLWGGCVTPFLFG